MTANPSISTKAIAPICAAANTLCRVYDENATARGLVRMAVSSELAHDTAGSVPGPGRGGGRGRVDLTAGWLRACGADEVIDSLEGSSPL